MNTTLLIGSILCFAALVLPTFSENIWTLLTPLLWGAALLFLMLAARSCNARWKLKQALLRKRLNKASQAAFANSSTRSLQRRKRARSASSPYPNGKSKQMLAWNETKGID